MSRVRSPSCAKTAAARALAWRDDRQTLPLLFGPAQQHLATQLAQGFGRSTERLIGRDQCGIEKRFSGHVGIAELLRKRSRDILVTDQAEALGSLPKAQIFLPLRDRYTIHIDLGELAGVEQQFAERCVAALLG
jgi:hypothetical protein